METPYYNITDSLIATALWMFGTKFPTDELGRINPCANTFTVERLRALGYKGRPVDEAANEAHKKGEQGILVFHFIPSDDQKEFCKGFDTMQKMIDEQNKQDPDADAPLAQLPISHEQLGQLVCMLSNKKKALYKLSRKVRARVAIMEYSTESVGDPEQRKSRITGHGKIRTLPE